MVAIILFFFFLQVALSGDGSRSMDVSFNNVLEGTRQYFMGLPKQAQAEGSGQSVWAGGSPLPEEGTPALSGVPAPSSRPPSAAAAPPGPAATPVPVPPRPPSEPLEPEPHIIHKATVMREAAEKRRELPEIEDEEDPINTLSPPSHIIHKPPPTQPSPAPAPAAPSPSPARPPSAGPVLPPSMSEQQPEPSTQYRQPLHHGQTPSVRPPEQFAPSRPPDPYSASRPPESYRRYHYEATLSDSSRNSHGPIASPQPSLPSRHSPLTYARLSSSMPQHPTSRLREATTHSPPAQRYAMSVPQPTPPHNDRVPPIHHPQTPPAQKLSAIDTRQAQIYPSLQQRRETSPYSRPPLHYERYSTVASRKYDPQQAYPGYRPPTALETLQNHRIDTHHQFQYKHPVKDVVSGHYPTRPQDRSPVPPTLHPHDASRLPPPADYPNVSRTVDARGTYPYPIPPASTSRYGLSTPPTVAQNSILPTRFTYRTLTTPKTNYDYTTTSSVQTSPVRSTTKPGYPSQQARMTVSVTSIVNQMNQTKQKRDPPVTGNGHTSQLNQVKQKRESPLDLSVKTVKNSADSSTPLEDAIDSVENKNVSLQARPSSSTSRHVHLPPAVYVAGSHKVDFAPKFSQYGDRSTVQSYATRTQPVHSPVRYNGSYESRRPVVEHYNVESPQQSPYADRSKYNVPVSRTEYVPRIDLTRSASDQRYIENKTRDDRHCIIDDRKRTAGPIVSNIPEKIVRYETWTADSRIERINQSTREQHELMRQPVYSYSSHKQFEAYQNEQKQPAPTGIYREHRPHSGHRYPNNRYSTDSPQHDISEFQSRYHDRNSSIVSRHQVIKRIPSHKDLYPHHLDPSGVPADQKVLSKLRKSLETKQTGFSELSRTTKQIPDLIVIDDVDDSVIEITDLTKDNDLEANAKSATKTPNTPFISNLNQHIQMPKAVDSLPRDSEYHKFDSNDGKSKSPESDVASRIRTKAELKVMPPSQDSSLKTESKQENTSSDNDKVKLLPKSQKQHLFNQIREDNLRLESVIKTETSAGIISIIPEVKTEPMNIEEIERDAEISIKSESFIENLEPEVHTLADTQPSEDMDWATACDSFMEQLKLGCHKKKIQKNRVDTLDDNDDNKIDHVNKRRSTETLSDNTLDANSTTLSVIVKQEPLDEEEIKPQEVQSTIEVESSSKSEEKYNNSQKSNLGKSIENKNNHEKITQKNDKTTKTETKVDKTRNDKKENETEKSSKVKVKTRTKLDKTENPSSVITLKREVKEKAAIKTIIKEELESTDDDEPLIKSKILKEKAQNERLKYKLLKDLSEKSAYVKLECCDVDVNKNSRKSIDSTTNIEKEDKSNKSKLLKQSPKVKGKSSSIENKNEKHNIDTSSDSDDEKLSVASRLRLRKNIKNEDNRVTNSQKTPVKLSPSKKLDSSSSTSSSSTPIRKPDFGDGSAFHPGWEEELYRYKRSLRMPTRLIAIPRGRSDGPFVRKSGALFSRGSTSLPDLDPAPLSPAPSSAPSAATDDLYARRPDKLTLDSDLDSNSSCSAPHRLQYDSEASTSTVFSTSKTKRKGSSIVEILIQKCCQKSDSKKKPKEKEDKAPKVIRKSSNTTELLPTPSLGLLKTGNKISLSGKKEKLLEDISYLGAFRKETVIAHRSSFINNTDGLIGATEEFRPIVLNTRTRTESRVLKQRATIKEVFGDERPASAPPTSCRDEDSHEEKDDHVVEIKRESESKPKFKPKKIIKDKNKRRSSSIRDGLRSTKSLKRNDAKGRLLRLKKRNNLIKSINSKRAKEIASNKHKLENTLTAETKEKVKEESSSLNTVEGNPKRRFKRLFGRRKISSGFDYIRKKKKIIRREDTNNKVRRPAVKPSPESIHDIHKEIKSWFINKSIGETHLHRAARLGYTVSIDLMYFL